MKPNQDQTRDNSFLDLKIGSVPHGGTLFYGVVLSMNSYFWTIYDRIFNFLAAVLFVLVNFFIWEQGESLERIIEFNFYLFCGTLLFAAISYLIARQLHPKLAFVAAAVTLLVVGRLIVGGEDNINQYFVLISFGIGAYYGLYYNSSSLITQILNKQANLVKASALSRIIGSLLSLIVPLLSAYLITQFGYLQALTYILFILPLMTLAILPIRVIKFQQQAGLRYLISGIFQDKTLRDLALIDIVMGATWTFGWGLLNVIVLSQLGSLQAWSEINVVLVAVGIIITFMLRKLDLKNSDKTLSLISGSYLLYAVIPLVLLFNFSTTIFIGFLFVQLFYDTITGVLSWNLLLDIEARDLDFDEKKYSYQAFTDIFNSIGRLLPILILILLPTQHLNDKILIFILAIITLMPIVIIKKYRTRFSTFGTG